MTVRDYIKKIGECKKALQAAGPAIAQAMALEGKDTVQQRIQEQQGIPGREYSRLTVRRKSAKGHKTAFITLTDTGRMWAGIHPAAPYREAGAWWCGFEATDTEVSAKVVGNIARYGQFLEPDFVEIARIQRAGLDQIDQILTRYL